jgi:hypothetical protein
MNEREQQEVLSNSYLYANICCWYIELHLSSSNQRQYYSERQQVLTMIDRQDKQQRQLDDNDNDEGE